MANASVLFLPWLRQGLVARLATPNTIAETVPASAELQVVLGVTAPENNPSATVRVRGPADVIGIDPRQVVRTEPAHNTSDFEAIDFAAIEFDNPDLPWMFTPVAADTQGRLRPWLCLVVVREQDGVRLRPAGSEPLPVLEIAAPAKPGEELPDLAESWAWAHAQVSWPHETPPDEAGVRTLLATRPELSVSRLLCPRRLAARTRYIACVVPAFEVGRLSGMGLPAPAQPDLSPAWRSGDQAPQSVSLPVYHQWAFSTGEPEDFESIVDRLAPRDLSDGVGQRPMDISQPGFEFAAASGTSGLVALEGALQPVGMQRGSVAAAAGDAWPAGLLGTLNAAGVAAQQGGDPLVGPPIYGARLAGRDSVALDTTPSWLDELNLDPRERVAAGLGTRVIQAQQDDLVAQAWAQAGEMAAVNQWRRQLHLAAAVGAKLWQRHVLPFTQGTPGQDDALWRLAAPAQARLMLAAPPAPNTQPAPAAAASMQSLMARTTASAASLSAPMRRLTRSRGAVARRSVLLARKAGLAAATTAPTGRLFTVFTELAPMMFWRVQRPQGYVGVDDVSARAGEPNASLLWSGMTDAAVAAAPRRPAFQIGAEPMLFQFVVATQLLHAAPVPHLAPRQPGGGGPLDPPDPVDPLPPRDPRPPRPPLQDSADAAAFRAAAQRHLKLTNPAPAPSFNLQMLGLAQLLSTQRLSLQAQLDPGPALRKREESREQTSTGGSQPAAQSGARGLVPRFAMPASEALARLSQDWLLPGLHNVPADTVALLETNQRFIEAYMLGLNVEMTRELLWRDFPLSHELGTCFDRFWRAARADKAADIQPIADWGTRRLGQNAGHSPGSTASTRPLVLLLRSSLLRRYPGTVVYAVRGVAAGGQRRPPDGAGEDKVPLFRGSLDPDVSFFGFDLDVSEAIGNAANPAGWYFVLQQQPTEPRFGVDEPADFAGASHVSVNQAPTGVPWPSARPWAQQAAQVANLLRQQPVRVMIHASELLPAPPAATPPAPLPPTTPPLPPPTPPAPPRPPVQRPPVLSPLAQPRVLGAAPVKPALAAKSSKPAKKSALPKPRKPKEG